MRDHEKVSFNLDSREAEAIRLLVNSLDQVNNSDVLRMCVMTGLPFIQKNPIIFDAMRSTGNNQGRPVFSSAKL